VHGEADFADGSFRIQVVNRGKTAVLQVRSGNSGLGPWTYTVGSGREISDTWALTGNNLTGYDLSAHGPNGFLRAYRGSIAGSGKANLDLRTSFDDDGNSITVWAANRGTEKVAVQLTESYSGKAGTYDLEPGQEAQGQIPLSDTYGWYDFIVEVEQDPSFRYQFAGHAPSEEESRTDPAIGTS
jgi:phospholipase C